MARKTFKDRIVTLDEAAWMVKNELGEIKQLFSDLEEEVIRLTEENRVLRLQLARAKQLNYQRLEA